MRLTARGESSTLEADIKQEARRLGFVLAGVTTPEPPAHAPAFEKWLSLGRHGQMAYMSTERSRLCRGDPRQIMPECKSILALAMPYSNPGPWPRPELDSDATSPRAKVAAYAWGRDYHDVIPERAQALVDYIERRAGRPVLSRCYTDTGPILERELAQRAGLGWIGKNTCLINPRLGSYFLLAEVLLDLELQSDAACETDQCGTCTRCVQACPTDCILPDRMIDARRCISYLTIEAKGAMPSELRSDVGDWSFGCDICQMVCPWNRFAPGDGDEALRAQDLEVAPSVLELLALTPEAFSDRSRGSPLRRAKFEGYLRNAVVVAGNVAGPEAIEPLERLAQGIEPTIAEHAAWALSRIASRTPNDE